MAEKRASLKKLVDERNPTQLRAALKFLIDGIVMEGAGSIDSPFAYLWDKDWRGFCELLGHDGNP
jgi:hypothetical protein